MGLLYNKISEREIQKKIDCVRIKYLRMRVRNKNQFEESEKSLKKEKKVILIIFNIIILLIIYAIILANSFLSAQNDPTTHSNMVFFVETANSIINTSNHVSYCESQACLNHPNSEGAIITEQYCDVTNSCEDGCVRRWLDQSSYAGNFNPPEYTVGRNFGQDDSEKPCYINDCINGLPCVRGGSPYGSFSQDKYLELQISDFIELPNEFSIFLFAKPIDQSATGDWHYFGMSNSFLRHDVDLNRLKLRIPGNPIRSLTYDNAVSLNSWHLIEIHRDSSNKITAFIDGVEGTNLTWGDLILPGLFKIGYLLSHFKTTGQQDLTGMYGDVAAFLIYNRDLTPAEKNDVRTYFQNTYFGGTLNTDNFSVENNITVVVSKNELQINNKGNHLLRTISIYNALGMLVKKVEFNPNKNLKMSLQTFSKGLYLVRVQNVDGQILTKKIIIK